MGVLKLQRAAMLLALLGLMPACRDDPPTEASIRIRLDTESIGSGCTSSLCSAYPMSCGALVSLRVTNPSTYDVLLRDDGIELSRCVLAPASEDLCGVADLDTQLFGIPAQNVRIEVAIFNPDDAIKGVPVADSCPKPRFDAFGDPVSTPDEPDPAFAGAAYFQAGDSEDVVVPLVCNNASLLSEDTCAANRPTEVRAVVTDVESMQTIRKEQAPSIAVAVGEARSKIDDPTVHVLETIDTSALLLNNTGAIPAYESNTIETRFGALVCSTTLDGQPQSTIAVRCEDVVAGAAKLDVQPLLIRKAIVDAALLALGETNFPEAGLIIGRVVDESFSPASGVAVTPVAGGSVLYLDEQLAGSAIGLTSASAYFVATDVPFGSEWIASHFDGRRQSGTPRGGLLQGKVSGVIIRMTGDVIGD